ncbi:uncharacterized protein LOC129731867 [Wyeomyia smithii]|uniref:uncharacterized protein LOC129731867 n=1 Tax=Wyeomyia smithii TaxID=174621 RepID=UPI002467B16A|nr:uncharacterized protein LOC129731867 [Wyeomyia smithii]
MAICSTHFARLNIRKHTWRYPNGEACSQIDHMLIDGRHFSDVIDVRSFRGPNIDTDHYLVVGKIRARLSNVFKSRSARKIHLDIQRLSAEGVAAEHTRKVDRRIGEPTGVDLNEQWKHIHDAVSETAREVIGITTGTTCSGWFDAECLEVTEEKNRAYANTLVAANRVTRQMREKYREARAAEKRLHRRKKREHYDRVLTEAENWRNRTVPVPAMCNYKDGNLITDKSQVARRWKQHFEVVLNGEEGRRVVVGNRIEIGEDGQAVDPPTLDEVKNACKELKNNKAAGKDDLPAELFKVGSERLCSAIHQIILRVWSEEQLPTDLLEGLICPIYEKGHRLECSNYRGITHLNSAYKILSRILFQRLRPLQEAFVGEYQCGFRVGRSTTDQMFTLRQILDKFREHNLQTHHLFIDFRAAYDTVKRNELWQIMLEHGFPTKLIKLIRATLDGFTSCVGVIAPAGGALRT